MMSIARYMDEHDIAQEVRLERKVHKGSFLLVEGTTDIKRFGNFIDDDECSLVNCYGRKNAIGAIRFLCEDGFPGALGAVHADFGRVDGSLEHHEGLVYSEAHDFDLDWVHVDAVQRYFKQIAEPEKCSAHETTAEESTKY